MRIHMHFLSGIFFCHVREPASLVVLKTLLGGAEHTRVNWDLASVTCLGIFVCSS